VGFEKLADPRLLAPPGGNGCAEWYKPHYERIYDALDAHGDLEHSEQLSAPARRAVRLLLDRAHPGSAAKSGDQSGGASRTRTT